MEVTKRIAQSTAVAQSRLQVLEARDGEVEKLVEGTRARLRDLAKSQGGECVVLAVFLPLPGLTVLCVLFRAVSSVLAPLGRPQRA